MGHPAKFELFQRSLCVTHSLRIELKIKTETGYFLVSSTSSTSSILKNGLDDWKSSQSEEADNFFELYQNLLKAV